MRRRTAATVLVTLLLLGLSVTAWLARSGEWDAPAAGSEPGLDTSASGDGREPVRPVVERAPRRRTSLADSDASEAAETQDESAVTDGPETQIYFPGLTFDVRAEIDGDYVAYRLCDVEPGHHAVQLFVADHEKGTGRMKGWREVGSLRVHVAEGERVEIALTDFEVETVCFARWEAERLRPGARPTGRHGSYGGSRLSVVTDVGMLWLARHESEGGGWSAAGFDHACVGQSCEGTSTLVSESEATALPVLALLGYGETHQSGQFKLPLRRALFRLKRMQTPDGWFDAAHDRREHAIATVAMVQAFGLTRSRLWGPSAKPALDLILGASPSGDVEVAVWEACALHAASVDKEWAADLAAARDRMLEQLRALGPPAGRPLREVAMLLGARSLFEPDPGKDPELVGAATALARHAAELVEAGHLDQADPTTFFFATIGAFRVGRPVWKAWNATLRPLILDRARFDGTWDPAVDLRLGRLRDRVTTTALNTLTLQLYYRYGRVLGAEWEE